MEKKIKAVRDRIFGDFSERVGVEDIGEHDKKMQEAQQAREEQLGSLRQQLDELELDRARLVRSIDDYEGKKRSLQKKDNVRLHQRSPGYTPASSTAFYRQVWAQFRAYDC